MRRLSQGSEDAQRAREQQEKAEAAAAAQRLAHASPRQVGLTRQAEEAARREGSDPPKDQEDQEQDQPDGNGQTDAAEEVAESAPSPVASPTPAAESDASPVQEAEPEPEPQPEPEPRPASSSPTDRGGVASEPSAEAAALQAEESFASTVHMEGSSASIDGGFVPIGEEPGIVMQDSQASI